jgi:hypothetical protein
MRFFAPNLEVNLFLVPLTFLVQGEPARERQWLHGQNLKWAPRKMHQITLKGIGEQRSMTENSALRASCFLIRI